MKYKVIYQIVLLNRPWILKLYPVRYSTNKSFKKDLFPSYNSKSEKHVYLLLFGKSLSIRNAFNSVDQSVPHGDAELRPENTIAGLNSPGKASPFFSVPSALLGHNATTNQAERTPAKAGLELPGRCHFWGGFQQINWKQIPAARLQIVGPRAALLQALTMFQHRGEHWQRWPRAHTMFLSVFPFFRSQQSLFEAGTWGSAVSKRGKGLKDQSWLQHPTARCTWRWSHKGKSWGKALGTDHPSSSILHCCPRAAHTTGATSSSCDFSNASAGRLK